MAKTAVLGNHTSSRRDAWWYLEQDDDGSLYIKYENDDDRSDNWRKPLHEVLAGSDGAKRRFEAWIGQMMEIDSMLDKARAP